MALVNLLGDGFDVYDSLSLFWSNPGTDTAIILGSGLQRSGLGFCRINSAAFGPKKVLTANFVTLLCTGALYPGGVVAQGEIFEVSNGGAGPFVRLFYGSDGSLFVTLNNGAALLQTGPGLFNFQAYNFVAFRVTVGNPGQVKLWLNGVPVIDSTVNLHGGTPDQVNTVQLMCNGLATGRWDDVSFWSCTTSDDFPFMPFIFPGLPVSDSAPLDWAPKTGVSHFPMVNSVPENETLWVSSATVGNVDQYIHAIPANQQFPSLPGSAVILATCHGLLAELDSAGARSIASNMAGATGPTSFALSVTPQIYQTCYTPGLASLAALATTPFGPEVTA